jgi:hypothetical protein
MGNRSIEYDGKYLIKSSDIYILVKNLETKKSRIMYWKDANNQDVLDSLILLNSGGSLEKMEYYYARLGDHFKDHDIKDHKKDHG